MVNHLNHISQNYSTMKPTKGGGNDRLLSRSFISLPLRVVPFSAATDLLPNGSIPIGKGVFIVTRV